MENSHNENNWIHHYTQAYKPSLIVPLSHNDCYCHEWHSQSKQITRSKVSFQMPKIAHHKMMPGKFTVSNNLLVWLQSLIGCLIGSGHMAEWLELAQKGCDFLIIPSLGDISSMQHHWEVSEKHVWTWMDETVWKLVWNQKSSSLPISPWKSHDHFTDVLIKIVLLCIREMKK